MKIKINNKDFIIKAQQIGEIWQSHVYKVVSGKTTAKYVAECIGIGRDVNSSMVNCLEQLRKFDLEVVF